MKSEDLVINARLNSVYIGNGFHPLLVLMARSQMTAQKVSFRKGNGDIAVHFQYRAYFTKRGLTKRTILHELYHHLVYVDGFGTPMTREERAANSYAKEFLS